MKERILELARQSGGIDMTNHVAGGITTWIGTSTPEFLEKFAELIVQETLMQMAIQMDKFGDDQSNNPAWYKSEEAVKKHFGVKE